MAALVGAGAIAGMFIADSVLPHGLGGWLVVAGRLTGLEGTYAVLLTVLMLARIWWLDRLVGMDRLVIAHRVVGQLAIWLLLAHTLLIIWGYGVSDHRGIASETKTVVLDLPDMLAATVAMAALVVVGIVSVRAARRRMKYQTWYFIHLYTYIAIALSFAHQFATGADFASHTGNRVVWAALYIAVFALLIWYRLVVPLRSSLRHRLRVARIVEEGTGSASIYLAGRNLSRLKAQPGQFFIWRFLTRDGWWQAHPFSLSAPASEDMLRMTVRASGDFTDDLASIEVGAKVIAEGPFGSFTAGRRRKRKALLIAGGAGIAPVRCLFDTIPADDGDITLLYRASDDASLALRDEVDGIAARRSARVVYLVGDRSRRTELFDPAALQELVGDDLAEHDAFVCGPRGFADGVVGALASAGVPRRCIHVERFEV